MESFPELIREMIQHIVNEVGDPFNLLFVGIKHLR